MRSANSSRSIGLITDATVILYGLWTVVCNVVMLTGGPAIRGLTLGVAVMCALLVALAFALWKRPQLRAAYFADLEAAPALNEALPLRPVRLAMLGWIAIGLFVYALAGGTTANAFAWGGSVIFALAAAVEALATKPDAESSESSAPPSELPYTLLALHAAALLCALFSLAVFRPRSDDPFYINMGVGLAMNPTQPLLSVIDMHGPPTPFLEAQRMYPPYRVHSFEALGGYVSYLTGIEVTYVVHMGLATLFSWLAPFAIARFFRSVAPRAVLLGVMATLAYYFIEGSASRGYSNQAFVRMFNGKGAMLTVMLPILCAYGIRFGQRPTAFRFALLALAQIGCVGLTSTALWLAPMLAGLSVVSAIDRPWQPKKLPTLLLAIASSAYAVGLGLWIKGQVSASKAIAAQAEALRSDNAVQTLFEKGLGLLHWSIPNVLGHQATACALLGMSAVALVLAPSALARRWLAALTLVLALVLANPWLAFKVTASLTGNGVYERVFWLLPVPLALGLAFIGIERLLSAQLGRVASLGAASAVLAAFLLIATEEPVISAANSSELRWPPILKQPPRDRSVAELICRYAKRDALVLAPDSISQLLPTLHGCGYPLMATMRWMNAPRQQEQRRNALVSWVGTKDDAPENRIMRAAGWLGEYGIDVIVFGPKAKKNRRMTGVAVLAGYEKAAAVAGHSIWVPLRKKTLARYDAIATHLCKSGASDRNVLATHGIAELVRDRGCGRSTLDEKLGDQARIELELAVSVDRDIAPQKKGWLGRQLKRWKPEVVVVSPAALQSNRRVLEALRKAHYEPTDVVQGYRLFEREKKAEPADAPVEEKAAPKDAKAAPPKSAEVR